jgi:hypothetical protein
MDPRARQSTDRPSAVVPYLLAAVPELGRRLHLLGIRRETRLRLSLHRLPLLTLLSQSLPPS